MIKIFIDDLDKRILKILSENSRITIKELSKKINLSQPSTKQRVMKLEDNGIILRYTIDINHNNLGYPLHLFLFFTLKSTSSVKFMQIMKKWEDHFIQQCQSSGDICFIVESRFKSQTQLTNFLCEISKCASCKVFDILRGSNQNVKFSTWFDASPNDSKLIQG